MITENEIIEILEGNILPGFKDIIGIFKDDYIDKRKPIFKKIAKGIINKIREREINERNLTIMNYPNYIIKFEDKKG